VPSSAWSVPMVSPGGSVGGGGGGGSKTPAWRRPSTSRTNATATTPPTTSGFIRPPPPPPERRRPGARFCFSRRSRRVVTVTARPEYRPRLDLEMSVRLRFSPWPAGASHIGSVRTFLHNYHHCRNIRRGMPAERATHESHVIRLKVPNEGTLAIEDLVHGHIEWQANTIEDQVLLKSDGFPTYHLAVVVDDRVMKITHIM